jgi:hypothetical protein
MMQSTSRLFSRSGTGVSARHRLSLALVSLLVALIVANFAVVGWNELAQNNSSATTDQGAYLRLGLKLREGRALTDGNRHPLFPLLLAPFASRDWRYFAYGKMVSLATGILGLITIFLLTRRRYSLAVGLTVILVLSLNAEYIHAASLVASEPLLVLLFFLAWYFAVSGFEDWTAAWAAGAFAGLTFLTKATGQLILLAFFVLAIIKWRRTVLRRRSTWVFLIAYLLVVLPLFIYNFRKYDDPLYNFNTQHAVWMDSWNDRYTDPDEEWPTLSSYLSTHSLQDMVEREWQGVVELRRTLAEAVLPLGWNWDSLPVNTLWFWAMIALLGGLLLAWPSGRRAVVVYYRKRREMLWLTGVTFVLFYLSFAWYVPVANAGRFLLPLAPLLLIALADFTNQLTRQLWSTSTHPRSIQRLRPLSTTGLAVGYLGLVVWLAASLWSAWPPASDVFVRDQASEGRGQDTMDWLLIHKDPRERVIRGPTHDISTWQYSGVFRFKSVPDGTVTWSRMAELMGQLEASYLIVDSGVYRRRELLFSQYFELVDDRLRLRTLPPGWELAYAEPGLPCDYCLLHLVEPAFGPPSPLPPVDFGEGMRLLGYGLPESVVQPGGTLPVALYWQAVRSLAEDYDVYVHLVGEDGQRVAEHDGPAVNGHFATGAWPVGETIADVHELSISPDVPAGQYHLEVGVHLAETREPLKASGPSGPLDQDRVVIHGILVEGAQ